jgi:hypothetical protein
VVVFKLILLFLSTSIVVWGHPGQFCSQFYSAGNLIRKYENHEQFRNDSYKRLIKIFRAKWFRQNEHHDVASAKGIVENLEKFGSPVDYAIFDAYLKIHENTVGVFDIRNGGFYYDVWEAMRPKSDHFQHIHWDWSIFRSYLFDNTRSVMLPRRWDLEYLSFVNETAVRMGGNRPLKAVLEQADHEWTLKNLRADPFLLEKYIQYKNGRSHARIYKTFVDKVNLWIHEPNSVELTKQREKEAQMTLVSFRGSTSIFDLMLMERYFDLVVRYKVEHRLGDTYEMVPKWVHLNDSLAIELGLSYGSLHYMTDFIFQNAHNLKIKAHVLGVLNLMEKNQIEEQSQSFSFFSHFNKAYFDNLDQVKKTNAPANYQTDLHIYSRSMNPSEATVDSLENNIVQWNREIGQLQMKTAETYPVARNQNTTVRSHPQLKAYVKEYFDQFRTSREFSETELIRDEAAELDSRLLNSTFFVFTRPNSHRLLSMARLFDGTNEKTYIESEFPHVEFPERKTNENIYEIGRLLSRPEVKGESLEIIMARIAEHLYTKKMSGTIYFDVKKAVRKFYLRKYPVVEVYNPKQLKLGPKDTPIWVMKMTVEKFIESFFKPEFHSIELRSNPLVNGDDS